MFQLKPISRAVALAFSGVALAVSYGMASAQTAPSVERIEITGSSIKQIQSESALPVQNYSREELQRTGATTAAEVIQALPAMQGFVQETISVGGGGNGFAGASLHLQGDSRTLVLLNGRRVAPFAGQTLTGALSGVDLNTIPLAAIERVEILADGASALYGSDAIGGVINFILRTNYSEGDIGLSGLVTEGGGAGEKRVTITKGFGDLNKEGYNLLAAVSFDKRSAMKATDREFSKTGIITFMDNGNEVLFFNGSSRTVPGQARGSAANGMPAGWNNPYVYANGVCPQYHVPIGPGAMGCYYDYASSLAIYPESEKSSLLLSGQKKIDANHTLFADVVLSKHQMIWKIAPPPVDMTVAPSSPAYADMIPMGANGVGSATVRWRGADAGNRTTKNETEAQHIVLGVKGTLGAWDYTTSYTHSTNEWKETYLAGWLLSNELNAALAAGSFNPFLEPGMQTPAGNAAIAGMTAQGLFKSATTTLDFFEARGSREISKLAGGALSLGAGIDYRRERTNYKPSDLAQGIGNAIAGDAAAEIPFDLSRNAWGAYAELLAPVSKQLELTGSVRYDRYSDFGDTTNGKLAVRYQPAPGVLLRASVGTGFKAPSVPQTADIQQSYGVTGGNYACPFVPSDPMFPLCAPGNSQYDVYAGGNPNLTPETSQQWTLGFRVEPTPKVSFGADLWNIEVKNRIGQLTEEAIFGDPVTYRSFFTTYTDPTTGTPALAIVLANDNLGKSKARGIDLDAKARFDTGVGKLTVHGIGTYMLDYKYQVDKDGPFRTNLGKFNDGEVTFRFQGRVSATLEYGQFEHTLAVNYKSGYDDQAYTEDDCYVVFPADLATGDCYAINRKVKSYATADWQTKWNINKQATLAVGIRNILDTSPPLSIKTVGGHQLGYDNRYADPRGRFYYVNFNHKF